jgi:ribonucleoside-diphosphate reductase alpha chain
MYNQISNMFVIKRSGIKEPVKFDKITERINKQVKEGEESILDASLVAQKVVASIYSGINTEELDIETAKICANLNTLHPLYSKLAGRILVSNLHKKTSDNFVDKLNTVQKITSELSDDGIGLLDKNYLEWVNQNKDELNQMIDYERDLNMDFFGFKTLERAYLLKDHKTKKIYERPQDMWLRVASFLNMGNLEKTKLTYDLMSKGFYTHASPTLYNSGTKRPQLSSCFLIGTEDSIEGITKTWTDVSMISKWAGGIGVHVSNIRAKDSIIRGTNGPSSGIIPMLQVYNWIARYINQGGKRKGSFAVYLEPHHPDIFEFLDLRKNFGAETERARDLFLALWVSDLFMEQVEKDGDWYLMCPDKCPGLNDTYGDEFKSLYFKYVREEKYNKSVKARKVMQAIMDSQIETGTPYMLYKDACNKKSNQKNLGTIKSSNLCVSGDTKILTDMGHINIKDLEGKSVNVWNGKEFSKTKVFKTGTNKELMKINFSDGCSLKCTPYHKFYILEKYIKYKNKKDIIHHKNVKVIEAQNLKPDMKLIKCDYPVINGRKTLDHAYTQGFFTGDGTYGNKTNEKERHCRFKALEGISYCKRHIRYQKNDETSINCQGISYTKKPRVTLYGDKMKLLEYLDYDSYGKVKDNKLNVTLNVNLKDKFFVPLEGYDIKSKLEWFSGYADADGCISNNQGNCSLQIVSIEKDFLISVKLMLQTCSVNTKISFCRPERKSLLPDGKGGRKYYVSKETWRLLLASNELKKIIQLGFSPKRLIIKNSTIQREAKKYVTISNTKNLEENEDTFCFTESKRNAGIFNGVITGQCAEIIEYSDHNETAVCNLASISINRCVKFPEHKGTWKVYTKTDCRYCKYTKNFLNFKNYEFEEIENANIKTIFNKEEMTYPQIVYYENGKEQLIGGFNELFKFCKATYDYNKLYQVAYQATRNLNAVIDINYYPTDAAKRSNMRHRPIGLGIQGLANTLAEMGINFDSNEAVQFNSKMMETIYYAAIKASQDIAKERYELIQKMETITSSFPEYYSSHFNPFVSSESNEIYHKLKLNKCELKNINETWSGAYSTFKGSPASEGILQFDMWNKNGSNYDWNYLKQEIIRYGVRNSLVTALMPTASTSQILGNNECFEYFTNNIYTRRTLAGDFSLVNKHLVTDLISIGRWNENVKQEILANNGSIALLNDIPTNLKNQYKTIWEIKQKWVLMNALARAPFVDQTQSMNIFMGVPDYKKLNSCHFWSWKNGLKTGMYYLRTKPAKSAIKFTVDPNLVKKNQELMQENEPCDMCSA